MTTHLHGHACHHAQAAITFRKQLAARHHHRRHQAIALRGSNRLEICSRSARRFGPSQSTRLWALADRRGGFFQRALFTPGADEFLGPPCAGGTNRIFLAVVPPKPYANYPLIERYMSTALELSLRPVVPLSNWNLTGAVSYRPGS